MTLFNLFLFTLAFSTCNFMFFYVNHIHAVKANKQKQLQGVKTVKNLRLLLALLQLHRGLTTGYLNGGRALLKRIQPLKEQINQKIAATNKQEAWLHNHLMWLGINDHWLRLANNYDKYASDYNFKQHCNLIINLLKLIEDCAQQHHLQALFKNTDQHTDFIWSQLLITAENIGQIRAIGTSIAAAKTATNIQLIQLDYLQSCINEFLSKPQPTFNNALIVDLLATINEQIRTPVVTMSSEVFFNLATAVIDDLLTKSDAYLANFEYLEQSPEN